MALEISDQNPIILDVYVDDDGFVRIRHGDVDIADHDDVVVRSPEPRLEVRFKAPSGWQLSAVHESIAGEPVDWVAAATGVSTSFAEPSAEPLEVFLVAQQSATTPAQTKLLRLQPMPGWA